ncbi:MAG: diguanylate cyclase [Oceanospirillales bacterium]|nr:diguanylate cyclase [Oceanospirillales bacterium]
MKIRAKLTMGMLLLLAAICIGVVATVQNLLLPRLASLEQQSLLTELERIRQSLLHEQKGLLALTTDWAVWDDTYRFVQDRNEEYASSNLDPSFMEPINVDAMLIQAASGEVVSAQFSESVDPSEIGFLAASFVDEHNPLYAMSRSGRPETAIMLTDAGAFLLAAHPILDSHSNQPPRGTFYMARLIGSDLVAALREQLQLPFELSFVEDSAGATVRFLSAERSLAQLVIPVANSDSRSLRAELIQPRPFYQQAFDSVAYTVIAICLIGLLAILFAYYFFNRMFVRPLEELKEQAESFGRDQCAVVFETHSRKDELGELANTFMQMAKSVETNRQMLQRERNQFLDASLTDPMTGLRNRRFLEQYLARPEVWQSGQSYLLMIMDIDMFKSVNDTYGHDVGDLVIKQFAGQLRECCRDDDLLIRTGGEEYALISLDCDASVGEKLAQRICSSVAQRRFGPEKALFDITCSVGFYTVAARQVSNPPAEWPEMLKVADLALYAVKNSGRNNWMGLGWLAEKGTAAHPRSAHDIERDIRQHRLRLITHEDRSPQTMCWQG